MIPYRQTRKDDFPALWEISRACGISPAGETPGQPDFPQTTSGWVASLDDKPIAFALADSGSGRLLVIAVQAGQQRKKIGMQLMRQAEAWLFSHGWQEIGLAIPEALSPGSESFFRSLGWTDRRDKYGNRPLFKANPQPLFKLEEFVVADAATGFSRLLRLQRQSSENPQRLCLFLDGEHYWRDMVVVPVLNSLVERGCIPPMNFAFVGHVSGAARHEDYTCNQSYSRFIGGAVMDCLKREIPGLPEGGHLIAGLSLSGLMAVYLTLQFPEKFSLCLSQSGSHWWKHDWFGDLIRQKSPISAKFWLSVGDQETQTHVKHPPTGLFQEICQIAGVEKIAGLLAEAGGTLRYHQYQGGHSVSCWRDEMGDALAWLLNPASTTHLNPTLPTEVQRA